MPNLEPTYLRYVYDGLNKGSLNAENAAALPQGFIGLYEQAFTQKTPANERERVLNELALWALFKGPVSAKFAADVLQMEEVQMKDLVDNYSSWFNSPESGKYQLYHERLRVYLLQKLSQREIIAINQLLLDYLKKQLEETTQNESVLYCFEHLSFHAYFHAKVLNDHSLLGDLCLNESFKDRQFKLSGFYDWEEQLMQYGISYFSLEGNPLVSKIVFEKTKIQFKRKNIDLIIDLIRRSEFDIVFNFFKNTNESDLFERLKLVYFYILSFHEIFEHQELDFEQKKHQSAVLLDVFYECFKWDKKHVYLSEYINLDISFRLCCYLEEYGLDITKYTYFSMDDNSGYYSLIGSGTYQEGELRFIDTKHRQQAKNVIDKLGEWHGSTIFDDYITGASAKYSGIHMIKAKSRNKIILSSNSVLYNDVLPCISQDVDSYNEMLGLVKYALTKIDISRPLKLDVFKEFRKAFDDATLSGYQLIGYLSRSDADGKLLKIEKKHGIDKNNVDYTKQVLSDERLSKEYFISINSKERYEIVSKIDFSEEFEMELLLAYLDLNIVYAKIKEKDIYDLCAALTIEFYLNTDSDVIEDYQNELIDCLWDCEHQTEFFENDVFSVLIKFLNQADVNGHIKNTLSVLKETLMDIYFDFRYYQYSFASGVSIINLYSRNEIPFPETEIFERIIEDLNELIEGDDYDEFWPIENCSIDNLMDKEYCDAFLKAIGQIKYENIKESFLDNITAGIINTKGLNFNTISFIKQKMTEYPSMYQRGLHKLSEEAAKTSNDISYYLLRSDNDLLLKRLLLNTVSKIDNLSDPLNQQILKYYNLNWVLRLYDDYLEISNTSN